MRRALTLPAAILVSLTPAGAQSVSPELAYFDHLSRSDGLSNSSISSIVQDSHGFLWFATQAGLNRYDGRSFRLYEHLPFEPNSLPHNLIQTLYEDPTEPVLWIGTYRGLSRFDMATETFTNYDSQNGEASLSNGVVTAISRDADGFLWVGTLDGLNRLDPESGKILRVGGPEANLIEGTLPHQTVRSLHVDGRGRLWIGTYGGLSLIDAERTRLETAIDASRLAAPAVMDIIQTGPRTLWLGVWDTGIVRYDPARDHLHAYELDDNRTYTLASRTGRYIFAGSWGGGLFRLDTASGEITSFRHGAGREFGLSHDTVYSLEFDDAGALWIGTNGGGVNRFSRRRVYRVRFRHDPERPDSLSNGKVTAIHRHSSGTLWIGTYNGGLNRYDPARDRMIHYRAPGAAAARRISDDIITSIFEDASGTLWVGTNDGMNRYDPGKDRFVTYHADPADDRSIPADIIYAFEQDREGRLWVGTYSAGVFLWDTEEGTVAHYPHDPKDPTSLSDNLVYDIHRQQNGSVWVATNRGVNRLDPGAEGWVRYHHDINDRSTISSDTTRTIHESANGTIWIGTTGGGLNKYIPETDSFVSYTRADGLASNTVTGILEDEKGRLWLATTNGVSVFDPVLGRFRNLDQEDGLGGLDFSGAAMRDTDGSLWFGGAHGVTVLEGSIREPNRHRPRMHITGVSVLGEPRQPEGVTFDGSTVRLGHRERSVGIEFVALDYASPEKNSYRFKLEGFDDGWTEAGTRTYTNYTRLPGGEYTFLVEGRNCDGVLSAEPARLHLVVQGSPWVSWQAVTAYVAAGLLVVYVVARLRERQVLARRVVELDSRRSELEEVNRELGEISVKDGLTGLFNRRYFDVKLSDAFANARRSGSELSLIMLDLDQFKRYNDLYGHPQGDECLKAIAEVLSTAVERASDFVSRYGGEEFAVLLFDTDCAGAGRVAERVRQQVQARGLAYPDSSVAPEVTISAGYCTVRPADGGSPEELVGMADTALYRAKAAGRNAVAGCPTCGGAR